MACIFGDEVEKRKGVYSETEFSTEVAPFFKLSWRCDFLIVFNAKRWNAPKTIGTYMEKSHRKFKNTFSKDSASMWCLKLVLDC